MASHHGALALGEVCGRHLYAMRSIPLPPPSDIKGGFVASENLGLGEEGKKSYIGGEGRGSLSSLCKLFNNQGDQTSMSMSFISCILNLGKNHVCLCCA
jgi:hypothetical protein